MKWIFYKSLVLMNIVFSVGLSLFLNLYSFAIAPDGTPFPSLNFLLQIAILIFITGGFAFSIGYIELYKKKQYSFFHNHSITKVKLILSALLINLAIGILLLIIVSYAKYAGN